MMVQMKIPLLLNLMFHQRLIMIIVVVMVVTITLEVALQMLIVAVFMSLSIVTPLTSLLLRVSISLSQLIPMRVTSKRRFRHIVTLSQTLKGLLIVVSIWLLLHLTRAILV